ncbi:MAG: hypothetical protein IKU94_06825 [Bacteroidaceae bacterium]|nr:hypothetical protein [Bacteroidaceae bacterium]
MKLLHIRWTFIEGLLGTSSANEEIYRDYLSSKAPSIQLQEEEAEAIANTPSAEEQFGKALTIFPKLPDGTPFQYDYQVKGFFKDSCSALSRLTGKDPETGKKGKAVNESSKLKAFKKEIDGNIFVFPRQIPIEFQGEISICQRPLRASTAQGERIALAASEEIPAGAAMEFWVLCLNDSHVPAVLEWMDYGILRGTGQWRNSGKGRFTYELIETLEPHSIGEAAQIASM